MRTVLAALCDEPSQWRHGYALARQTGLKSGTLYPILIRLADRGLVEACWQDEPVPSRPRRHLYRLTAGGVAAATEALAAAERAVSPASPARRSQRLAPGNGEPPRPPGYTATPDPPGGVQFGRHRLG